MFATWERTAAPGNAWPPSCLAAGSPAQKLSLLLGGHDPQVAREEAIRLIDEKDEPLLSQNRKGQRQNEAPAGQR